MSRTINEISVANYKALKEEFVSNLTGGTITEINCVTAVAPISVTIWSFLQSRYEFFTSSQSYNTDTGRWTCLIIEFFLNVISILLATTLYASEPILYNAILLVPILIPCLLLSPSSTSTGQKKWRKKSIEPQMAPQLTKKNSNQRSNIGAVRACENSLPKRPFLTSYRGSMLVITCLSILAIDFHVFPRRFAKVETWGTSLMDIGVGSFVFSTGIVAARPLLSDHEKDTTNKDGVWNRLLKAGRQSFSLLVLGLLRLWSVKELDYAEHVSEYGVHWNFFFTLGFLPPFVTLFQSIFRYIPSHTVLTIILSGAYQITLEFTSLKIYILTASRDNLLSSNREGIFSFVGYLAIFIAGQGTGLHVLPRRLLPKNFSAWEQRKRLLILLFGSSLIWILFFIVSTHRVYGLNLTVSRRLANLPYIFWIIAFNNSQLAAFCLVETIFFPNVWKLSEWNTGLEEKAVYRNSTSTILEAYNRNGLAVFLLANLLTGAVNISISTLDCSDIIAMLILVIYAATITGVALALHWWDISIKL